MAIGMGNLLDAFAENGLTNHVKGGILHMSRPPQAVEVESEADLEALGELPAGSIAYTSEYAHMWQLTGSGTWATTEEKGGSGGGGGLVVRQKSFDETRDIAIYDKTWQEVHDAISAGALVIMEESVQGGTALAYCAFAGLHDGAYTVVFKLIASTAEPIILAADSPDDYLDDGTHSK